ncbi:STAS domain-containing protein [Streptomyces pakalii]|uniref:Anti-sigma factor antagonist n=1 Tax=Streptomyces pakalii TaxID=3036494 RepID=A0ABT7DIL7_9ACTN|nr:STAS domain-containing protein [Streptomyces pakalii]MDJ1645393.1 STAS domain-containing protein [Streptomyces pakalii]
MAQVSTDAASGPQVLVLRLSGALDYESEDIVSQQLRHHIALSDAPDIVLNLADVSFCDSTGLNTLLRAFHAARDRDAHLTLAEAPAHLARILAVTGIDKVMLITGTNEPPAEPEGLGRLAPS